jgi:adenylate cyclase
MKDEKGENLGQKQPGTRRFYLRNIGANLFGFITIAILNAFTPTDFFRGSRSYLFNEGGWKLFLLYPFVPALVALLQYRLQAPLSGFGYCKGMDALMEKAKRRLLNLPSLLALVNLTVYAVLPGMVVLVFYFVLGASSGTCLFIYFRVLMIGLITASLCFFLIEDHSRKTWIPYFFPKGRLTAFSRTVNIPLLRRIRVLYGAGTLNPMILLLGTLSFAYWESKRSSAISGEDFIRDILLFTIILCAIFIVFALRLNVLVARSIQVPVREMLKVVEKVKEGDFTHSVTVVSNDEIGQLGDAANAMVQGLAERERIRDAFGKYVTPEIRDEILNGRIPLNGERCMATLLFSDLRDFTPYVERNSPEEVIRSMRKYFTVMENAIRKYDGLVLQYVGDEIEAVFGVPIYQEKHAERAVLAALEMRRSLDTLNQERERERKPLFKHGIGIHTGIVLAGNTGSEQRLSYALIGDTVNLASRIEKLTKDFNCDILVSEETADALQHAFPMEREGPKEIKGYSRPMTLYRLL